MNRQTIITEYFELRNFINRANKRPNMQTDIGFEIEAGEDSVYRLVAFASGGGAQNKVVLCERTSSQGWERAGYSRFQRLETFCAEALNSLELSDTGPGLPKRLSENRIAVIKDDFERLIKMLFLKERYEP